MKLEGVYTAIITPFTADGSAIDYDAFGRIVEKQIAGGVTGIVPCGTTGESPTLSHDEHSALIERTVAMVNGRCEVLAGTGSNSTAEAVAFTQDAVRAGVDGVMLVNPYYNKPSQRGLLEHFRTVARASGKPVVVYNIKGRTGVNVEVETFRELLELDNVRAVKEASGDPGQMARMIGTYGDRLSLLSGDDGLTPALMALGGRGVISVISNLYPAKLTRMVGHYLKEEFSAGNKIYYELLPLMNALFWDTNPVPVKWAAARAGLCQPALRLPLVEMDADLQERIGSLLDQVGADA